MPSAYPRQPRMPIKSPPREADGLLMRSRNLAAALRQLPRHERRGEVGAAGTKVLAPWNTIDEHL